MGNRFIFLVFFVFLNLGAAAQDSLSIKIWHLGCQLQDRVTTHKNFEEALSLFRKIEDLDSDAAKKYYKYAALCFDKMGRPNKSLQIMNEMYQRNDMSFCVKNYDSDRTYSEELQENIKFKKLCPSYDYSINLETSEPQFRDSIIKYIIFASDFRQKNDLFIKMGRDNYYPKNKKILKMSQVERILISETKLDSLVNLFGYPTLEKVGDEWVQFLFNLSLTHSITEGRQEFYLEKYTQDIPKQTVAYMKDKLAVKNNVPQIYGTQFVSIDGKLKLYPIEGEIDDLDQRRQKMRMLPFDLYLKDMGLSRDNIKM